jgi:hypothetical protein
MVEVYELIFTAQEDSKRRINIDPIQISAETLSIKIKENFPLINLVRVYSIRQTYSRFDLTPKK